MKHKTGSALILTGVALILAALGLIGYNLWTQQQADQAAQTALTSLTAQISTHDYTPDPGTNLVHYPDHVLTPDMEMPEKEVDGVAYIGTLAIPRLQLELPVSSQMSRKLLKIAPCRDSGTAYLDDFVIGAHNYDRHFGRIGTLAHGDEVIFTDMDGNVFTYQVMSIETLQPYEGEILRNGEWDLSLFTCTVGGQSRIVVRCDKLGA